MPLIPAIRTSSTTQPILSRSSDAMKASADSNVWTGKPHRHQEISEGPT